MRRQGRAGSGTRGAKSRVLAMGMTRKARCLSPVSPNNPEGGPREGTARRELSQESHPALWLQGGPAGAAAKPRAGNSG